MMPIWMAHGENKEWKKCMDNYQMKNGIYLPLNDILKPFTGILTLDLFDAKSGKLKERQVYHNMFVTIGKQSVARWLQGDTTAGPITWAAVGTNGTAPALTDTMLKAEISRKQIAVRSFATNAAQFQTYFGTADGNGTLLEAAMFGDTGINGASSTPNSGCLFVKAAISRVKTVNDTLTMTWTITVG